MTKLADVLKEESYKYYLGIIKQIQKFYKDTEIKKTYKK